MAPNVPDHKNAAEIIRDAGGTVVGRTRLQKIAFLLELAGLGCGFQFSYRHYGPYSEHLADALQTAEVKGLVKEEEHRANWGGMYSVYTAAQKKIGPSIAGQRTAFAKAASEVDAIELELAATAAYLYFVEECKNPWDETARRKPTKAAENRLEKAKAAYQKLRALEVPNSLPQI